MATGPASVRAEAVPSRAVPELLSDPDVLAAYLEDASSRPPGRALGLLRPADEAEVSAFIRSGTDSLLPQAARSSLTGGAVPDGEVVVSVERLNRIGPVRPSGDDASVAVGAGVRLDALQSVLQEQGWYYPPVPTYQEAMIGGTASTNAGGAATFKYGVTRQWIRGIRVVLFNGDVLALERGQALARPGERFRVETSDGTTIEVPVPSYRLPDLKKISAGYHSADPLDLVDLFVGSEGTLGLLTEVTVGLVRRPAAVVTGVAFPGSTGEALALAGVLRRAALKARRSNDPDGPDVRAIEFADERCLAILRRHGDAARLRVEIPPGAGSAVLLETELPAPCGNDRLLDILEAFLEGRAQDGPLERLFDILARHRVLDSLQLALPDDEARRAALSEFRESVPRRVNEILGARRREDPAVRKVGGDLIVPFDRLGETCDLYVRELQGRGLEHAVWGHLSDGNLHPNVLPRNVADVRSGEDAQLRFADEVTRMGGCPLSEHGVGRSALKQALLRRFLGDDAISQMRSVKRALDPFGRFAPGVLFPAAP